MQLTLGRSKVFLRIQEHKSSELGFAGRLGSRIRVLRIPERKSSGFVIQIVYILVETGSHAHLQAGVQLTQHVHLHRCLLSLLLAGRLHLFQQLVGCIRLLWAMKRVMKRVMLGP